MPFIEVPNTAQLTLLFQTASHQYTNGLAFLKATAWTEEQLQTMVDTVEDAWDESLKSVMCTTYFLTGAKARSLEAEVAPYADTFYSPILAGTRSGADSAANVALSITFGTGAIGRSHRGRMYWAGLSTLDKANTRQWTSAVASEVSIAVSIFANAIATATESEHAIVSRQEGNVVLAEGNPQAVTSYQGRTPVATQRGRVRP